MLLYTFFQEMEEDVPLAKKDISKAYSSKDGPRDTSSEPASTGKKAPKKSDSLPAGPAVSAKESKAVAVQEDLEEGDDDLACVETIPGSPVMSPDESGCHKDLPSPTIPAACSPASKEVKPNTAKEATKEHLSSDDPSNKRTSEMPFASVPLSVAGPADPPPEKDKAEGKKAAEAEPPPDLPTATTSGELQEFSSR